MSNVGGAPRIALLGAALAAAALALAPQADAQGSSGAIVFPPVTNTSIGRCAPSERLSGPAGGSVRLRGGNFFLSGGGPVYATANNGLSCSVELLATFAPSATDVSITVKTLIFVKDEIRFEIRDASGVTAQQFTVQPQGSVTMHAQGEIGSVSIQSVRTGLPTNLFAFGISSIVITQGPVDNSEVIFDAANGPEDSKILISKAVWDIGNPSRFQLPPDGGGNPRIKVSGKLRDRFSGQGLAGQVHLRVDDPPDPAPYRGGDAAFGDNDGTASFQGSSTVTVQADSQGRFETELLVSKPAAGDNYQVIGATNAQFNCGVPCPRSPVFTMWKRVYVEEQQMFRRGSFLNNEVVAGNREIPVEDPTPFQGLASGETLQLVHAAPVQGEAFYSDRVTFDSLRQSVSGQWLVVTAPATPVPRKYGVTPNPAAPNNPILNVIRDGVGVVSAGTFKTNPAYAEPLFASMFVDLKPNPGAVTEVPYVAEFSKPFTLYFSNHWLQQGVRSSTYSSKPDPNVFHRIAARQAPLVQVVTCHGAQLGITSVGGGGHYSYIFDQRIQDVATGLADPTAGCPQVGLEYKNAPASVVNGEVTAHEVVHFWVRTARQPDLDGEGHCTRARFIDATNCLMHQPYAGPELFDGQVLLHYDMNGAHSEYMWIRRDPDPVPQQ